MSPEQSSIPYDMPTVPPWMLTSQGSSSRQYALEQLPGDEFSKPIPLELRLECPNIEMRKRSEFYMTEGEEEQTTSYVTFQL